MALLEVEKSGLRTCLHREGQLSGTLDTTVEQHLHIAWLTWVRSRRNDLVVDHFDNVEAQFGLQCLLVSVCSCHAWHTYYHGLLKLKLAPIASKLWRCDCPRSVWRFSL